MIRVKHCFKNGQLSIMQVFRCRQLALDDVVDTDVDYTSNDGGSSPTYFLLSYLLFFFFLSSLIYFFKYKTSIMYFEWRRQSDLGVSILVTTQWRDAILRCPSLSNNYRPILSLPVSKPCIIIHSLTPKQRKIKFKPKIKLNYNKYTLFWFFFGFLLFLVYKECNGTRVP